MLEITNQDALYWSRLGMRKAYGDVISRIAQTDPNIVCIAADVADSANLGVFRDKCPRRYFNVGISEQNMIGVACGLAKEGYNVFVTSFAPFVSLRAYEAIRTLVCYMNLNVKIVALSSGFSLGVQGATHYALEDIAIMRAIPGLAVLSPADTTQMAKMLEYLADYDGAAYLRLTGIPGSPCVYKDGFVYHPQKSDVVKDGGKDAVIFATGAMVNEAVRASRLLAKERIGTTVVNVSRLDAIDKEEIKAMCAGCKLVVTVEEHYITGGLGSIVSECIAERSVHPRVVRIGTAGFNLICGNYAYMLEANGLTAKRIAERIRMEYAKEGYD